MTRCDVWGPQGNWPQPEIFEEDCGVFVGTQKPPLGFSPATPYTGTMKLSLDLALSSIHKNFITSNRLVSQDATFKMYTDPSFTTEVVAIDRMDSLRNWIEPIMYLKITSGNTENIRYYAITLLKCPECPIWNPATETCEIRPSPECPLCTIWSEELQMCICDDEKGCGPLMPMATGPDSDSLPALREGNPPALREGNESFPMLCGCQFGYAESDPPNYEVPCEIYTYTMDACWLLEEDQKGVIITLNPHPSTNRHAMFADYTIVANGNEVRTLQMALTQTMRIPWIKGPLAHPDWEPLVPNTEFTNKVLQLDLYLHRANYDYSHSGYTKIGTTKVYPPIATKNPVTDLCPTN